MKISNFLQELRERNTLLFWGGVANGILFFIFLICSWFDHRTVLGINTWIKPMKFTLSFVIFLWTFGWMLFYLPNQQKAKWLSIGFFVCMIMEISTISVQAARGVRSHFNISSLFDGVIYQLMGIFILINTLLAVYLCIQFFQKNINLSPVLKIAWRAGLLFFLIGAVSGGMMVALTTHTIGMADGGPGLPFLNWSRQGGDLRVAHFVTLHSLQVIPIFAYLVSESPKAKLWTIAFSIGYALLCITLHVLALKGIPLLPMF